MGVDRAISALAKAGRPPPDDQAARCFRRDPVYCNDGCQWRMLAERTFAWLGRCRRMAGDREKPIASAEAWLLIAHIRRVTRMLARQ